MKLPQHSTKALSHKSLIINQRHTEYMMLFPSISWFIELSIIGARKKMKEKSIKNLCVGAIWLETKRNDWQFSSVSDEEIYWLSFVYSRRKSEKICPKNLSKLGTWKIEYRKRLSKSFVELGIIQVFDVISEKISTIFENLSL